MTRVRRLNRFAKGYSGLTDSERDQVDKALRLLVQNPRHPSLHVKKIRGVKDVWEARASRDLRITFNLEGALMVLRNVGHHDVILGNP